MLLDARINLKYECKRTCPESRTNAYMFEIMNGNGVNIFFLIGLARTLINNLKYMH